MLGLWQHVEHVGLAYVDEIPRAGREHLGTVGEIPRAGREHLLGFLCPLGWRTRTNTLRTTKDDILFFNVWLVGSLEVANNGDNGHMIRDKPAAGRKRKRKRGKRKSEGHHALERCS